MVLVNMRICVRGASDKMVVPYPAAATFSPVMTGRGGSADTRHLHIDVGGLGSSLNLSRRGGSVRSGGLRNGAAANPRESIIERSSETTARRVKNQQNNMERSHGGAEG